MVILCGGKWAKQNRSGLATTVSLLTADSTLVCASCSVTFQHADRDSVCNEPRAKPQDGPFRSCMNHVVGWFNSIPLRLQPERIELCSSICITNCIMMTGHLSQSVERRLTFNHQACFVLWTKLYWIFSQAPPLANSPFGQVRRAVGRRKPFNWTRPRIVGFIGHGG